MIHITRRFYSGFANSAGPNRKEEKMAIMTTIEKIERTAELPALSDQEKPELRSTNERLLLKLHSEETY